jgi:copper chaperone NosL
MKNGSSHHIYWKGIFTVAISLILVMIVGCATSGSKTAEKSTATESAQISMVQPMVIPKDVSCGKCGMYPASYPRWQSQIVFKDGSMTPFDGCKCMFNFMNAMGQYDKAHTSDDVAAILVKDFSNGKWMNASDAHFVVGSKMMGPMGKELVPFADKEEAMKFHHEQGGSMMMYGEITPEVLKTLGMGGMKMEHGSGHMKM